MDSEKPLAGGIPMVNIDGARIRQLREEKALTQLYVATVVGVTTDTISRWENRRYPNIKKENALKLAEALEVQLTEIIERGQSESRQEPPSQLVMPEELPASEPDTLKKPLPETKQPWALHISRQAIVMFGAILLLAFAGIALFLWHTANEGEGLVTATRTMPAHATPGIPFPVVIEVTSRASLPFSLILKETLPKNVIPSQGKPRFVFQASDPLLLKWIDKITGEYSTYSYLAKLRPETKMGTVHKITGGVTVRSDNNPSISVAGTDSLQASPYHWADSNSDGRIDDEELLSVYEIYGDIEDLRFGKELIEEIWTAKGYRWNPEARSYEILR